MPIVLIKCQSDIALQIILSYGYHFGFIRMSASFSSDVFVGHRLELWGCLQFGLDDIYQMAKTNLCVPLCLESE